MPTNSRAVQTNRIQSGATAISNASGNGAAMTIPQIWDEPQQNHQNAPKRRVRDADQCQPEPDRQSATDVHDELREEVSTDPLSRIVHRFSGAVQVTPSGESQQPIPKILPLEQDHDDENNDQSARRHWLEQRPDDPLYDLQRSGFRRHYLDRYGFGRRRLEGAGSGRGALRRTLSCRPRKLLAEVTEHLCRATENTAAGHHSGKRTDFGLQVVSVFRELLC